MADSTIRITVPSTTQYVPGVVDVEERQEVRGVRPPTVSAGTVSQSPSSGRSDAVSSDDLASHFEPGAGPIPAHMFGALTPETIIALVRRQVDHQDQQVQSLVTGIEERAALARNVQERLEILQAIMTEANRPGEDQKVGRDHPVTVGDHTRSVGEWLDLIGAEGDLSPDGDGKIGVAQLESFRDQLRSELTRINTGNEMDMLALQNVMQQRSQVIQIGTNVMNSMHESAQGAIRNIG